MFSQIKTVPKQGAKGERFTTTKKRHDRLFVIAKNIILPVPVDTYIHMLLAAVAVEYYYCCCCKQMIRKTSKKTNLESAVCTIISYFYLHPHMRYICSE